MSVGWFLGYKPLSDRVADIDPKGKELSIGKGIGVCGPSPDIHDPTRVVDPKGPIELGGVPDDQDWGKEVISRIIVAGG